MKVVVSVLVGVRVLVGGCGGWLSGFMHTLQCNVC